MDSITQFEPFCGLHYTTPQDSLKFADSYDSIEDKSFIFNIYYNYFINIVNSLIKLKNAPETIDDDFVIKTLIRRGSVAFFKLPQDIIATKKNNSKLDVADVLFAQPFNVEYLYSIYGRPTRIILQSAPNCDQYFNGIVLDNTKDFEVVKLNPLATSLNAVVYYFVNKLTEVQRAIDVNVFNNQTPLVIEAVEEQKKTIETLMRKWTQQLKYIVLNKKNARKEDLLQATDIGAEWKASHMVEAMLYYKSEFYTMIGVNHTPYEKKANLVKDEVRSNSHILRLTIDSMLDTLNTDIKLVNDKFGTDMYFEYALDSIYDTSIPSEVESEYKAGIITEEERVVQEIENAKLKTIIREGEE
jgi:hypothetical protein